MKRTWLRLTWSFCSNHHTNAKFTFLWCHILWGGDGVKSSDGHISYGKGERKWARKNAFHQPKGSSRKMEYRKKICKWGISPLRKTYMWKPIFSMGSINQELLLAPNSSLRFSLSNRPFCSEITLFYKHCNYPTVFLTTFLLYPPIKKTLKISRSNVLLPTFP